ncbi:MAG TPA: PIG-L family deacetylase [Anaerolineaceae bacterium]|nr:PIG-L family deacetylase [Anaerolineaceae bacterium]
MASLTPIHLANGNKPVLLAIMAHPDDETFGTGGTLAVYARRSVKVYLICATRGEVGEMEEQYLRGFASIAERRMAELRCAAEKLGIAEVIFLPYRDSGMPGSPDNTHPQALAAQPVEQVAGEVAGIIRRLQPQVVVTFDPYGGYGHPDHIAIHQATVRAVALAADPNFPGSTALPIRAHPIQRLYFHTPERSLLRIMVKIMPLLGHDPRKFGKNKDIDLAAIAGQTFPVHARISYRPVAKIRAEAAACHASQGGGKRRRGILDILLGVFSANEHYMRALPPPGPHEKVEKDFFQQVI